MGPIRKGFVPGKRQKSKSDVKEGVAESTTRGCCGRSIVPISRKKGTETGPEKKGLRGIVGGKVEGDPHTQYSPRNYKVDRAERRREELENKTGNHACKQHCNHYSKKKTTSSGLLLPRQENFQPTTQRNEVKENAASVISSYAQGDERSYCTSPCSQTAVFPASASWAKGEKEGDRCDLSPWQHGQNRHNKRRHK